MLSNRHIGPRAVSAVVLVMLLGWGGSADARQFKMSGNWAMEKSANFFLPIPPGAAGIGGSGTVTGQPAGTLTVPPNLFTGTYALAIPLAQTSIIQLATSFIVAGPAAPAVLKAGNWVGTRGFANFAWCPGATLNPACTTPQSVTQGAPPGMGTSHGLVRYTAGTKQFGGTMQMVRGGGGTLSLLIGTNTAQHNPLGVTGFALQNQGGPYANTRAQSRPGGPITTGFVVSGGGLITQPGVQVGTGSPTGNLYQGFPMTTGQVYVRVTVGRAGPSTITVTGSDARTPGGAGNITLVAGGLVQRLVSGQTLCYEDTVKMTLSFPVSPLPSMSPTGVAAGALLMVLAVGYALKRRF